MNTGDVLSYNNTLFPEISNRCSKNSVVFGKVEKSTNSNGQEVTKDVSR